MVAKFRYEEIDQAAAMNVLLGRHFLEYLRARGKGRAQAFREVGVDASVFLLRAHRQREDFTFGEIIELAHRGSWRGRSGAPESKPLLRDAGVSD